MVACGEPPALAELTDFLRRERRIAPQKLPEMLQVVDALPTTMTGKVQSSCCATRPAPRPISSRSS